MSEKNNAVLQMNTITATNLPEPLVIKANSSTTGQINFNPTETTGIANPLHYYQTYPYVGWPYYQYTQPAWVSINKAENGFIVIKNGQTFVCKSVEEITELLSKKE